MNSPLSTLERRALHTVTESLQHQVQAPTSSPAVVRDVVRLVLALGAEPRPSGYDDVGYRTHLIRKVRQTMVALDLPRFEQMFQTAKQHVLVQQNMDR